MGLSGGDHGIKNFVKTNWPAALRDFATLADAVKASGHRPDQAVVILDGNVLINQVPTAVDDFDGYVRVFGGFVNAGLRQPIASLSCGMNRAESRAPLDEQRRRDLARAKTAITMSADLAQQFAPTSDDYGLDTIDKCNPHDLCQPCRPGSLLRCSM